MENGLQTLLGKIKTKMKDDIVLVENRKVEAISSGSLLLDSITGGGLLIKGRMVEISGKESSGKTTLCLQSAVEAIKKGKQVLFMDFEQTFDVNYAKSLGLTLNHKQLGVVQPHNLEEGVAIIKEAEKLLPDEDTVIIVDSVAAAKPKKLLEAAGDQQQIGLHAQRFGEFSSYLNSVWCGKKKCYILFTNQVRSVPSTGSIYQAKALKDSGLGFGSSNDTSLITTGGNQLKYMLSVRVLLDFAGKVEEGSYEKGDLVRTGNYIKAYTLKNKICPPFQTCKLAIIYGQGTDDTFTIIDTLKDYEYITQGGGTFTYIDYEGNEVGAGLSFKQKGKDAFYEKLKAKEYQEDMNKTFKYLMETQERAEIVEDEEEGLDDEISEEDF